MKTDGPKKNQLPKFVSTKAVNVKTDALKKTVQKDFVSKHSDLSDSCISELCALKRIQKKKRKWVKECSQEWLKLSTLSSNNSKNKMSVTDTSSDVTNYVQDATVKTCSVKILNIVCNRKCSCLSCSKLLASHLHSFTLAAYKIIKCFKCAKGITNNWIPKSELQGVTNSKGTISAWVPKCVWFRMCRPVIDGT